MKDFKDFIRLIIIGSTIVANIILIYFLLHNPYALFLQDKNQPYNLPKGNEWTNYSTIVIMGLLLITSVYLLKVVYKKQKIALLPPLFTVLVIISLFVIIGNSPTYPSSTSGYPQDGYYYKMEIWWNTPNHIRIYKRWKSFLPYDGKTDPDVIKYEIDSLSKSKEE